MSRTRTSLGGSGEEDWVGEGMDGWLKGESDDASSSSMRCVIYLTTHLSFAESCSLVSLSPLSQRFPTSIVITDGRSCAGSKSVVFAAFAVHRTITSDHSSTLTTCGSRISLPLFGIIKALIRCCTPDIIQQQETKWLAVLLDAEEVHDL